MSEEKNSGFSKTLAQLLAILLCLPLFLLINNKTDFLRFDWPYNLDRILLLIIILVVLEGLLQIFRELIAVGVAGALIWLGYGSFFGQYGFSEAYRDYQSILYHMATSDNPGPAIVKEVQTSNFDQALKSKVDYMNESVRNEAIQIATKHFPAYENSDLMDIAHAFSIFKEINSRWKYIHDPKNAEYFAKASESIQHYSGDCDDHTILMVSCLKAIGIRTRMVYIAGHIYPELYVGNEAQAELIRYLVKKEMFAEESRGKSIYMSTDAEGEYWINLDYTDHYPGGPYMEGELFGYITTDSW